jgi:hypothetical protein
MLLVSGDCCLILHASLCAYLALQKLSPELKKQVDSHRQAAARKAAFAEQLEVSSLSSLLCLLACHIDRLCVHSTSIQQKAKQSADADAPVWATQAAQKARDSTPPQ